MYINDDNDLYITFEVVKQIAPKKCIDIGPLLKRAGCIARQVKNEEISRDIILDGVDFTKNCEVKVYNKVYNRLYDKVAFYSDRIIDEVSYDLGILMKSGSIMSTDEEKKAIIWCRNHCKYLLTDKNYVSYIGNAKVRTLSFDDDKYYLYFFKD